MVAFPVDSILILRFKIVLKRIDGAVVIQINEVSEDRWIRVKDEEIFLEVQNAVLISIVSAGEDSIEVDVIRPVVVIVVIFNEGVIRFIPRILFRL